MARTTGKEQAVETASEQAVEAPKVLYRKTVDTATGVLADMRTKTSRAGNDYFELVFEDGSFIQMPSGFRIPFDLVQGVQYSAKWEDGRFTIVEGELPVGETGAGDSEDVPF